MHNLNEVIKYSYLDLAVGKSRWGYGKYNKSKTKIVPDIINKPSCSRGGQVKLYYDSNIIFPSVYICYHKYYLGYSNFI